MSGRILTPLEVVSLKRETSDDNVKALIATLEDAWAERDQCKRVLDGVWKRFGEMSKFIREGLKH